MMNYDGDDATPKIEQKKYFFTSYSDTILIIWNLTLQSFWCL